MKNLTNKIEVHSHELLDQMLKPFSSKVNSVFVIVENYYSQYLHHKSIMNFIIKDVFDNLNPDDYFAFMSLQQGKHPYT